MLDVGMKRENLTAAFNHSFNEQTEFYSFLQWSKNDIQRSDSGHTASRGPALFLAAPGSHVGNPEWGGYAIGQTAELGYFAPAIGLERPASISNAPIALANGGANVPMSAHIQTGNFPRVGGNTNK